MKTVLSTKDMRESDRLCETPSRELMLRAGRAIFEELPDLSPAAVICGTGNNGGDGFAVAWLMAEAGRKCTVFLTGSRFSEDGRYFFDLAVKAGAEVLYAGERRSFADFPLIIDCIYGTGFHGEPDDGMKALFDAVNSSGAYVVSADINSGLNADSGLKSSCIISDLTVSVGCFKPGHFLGQAKDVMKAKINRDIGIPAISDGIALFEDSDVSAVLGERLNYSNKSSYGYIALIGGSGPYSGAVKLANTAACAMRAGAGVVKLACPGGLYDSVAPHLLESTFFGLSGSRELIFDEAEFSGLCAKTKAAAFGMGIGRSDEVKKALSFLLSKYEGTLIIDADGLNVLSENTGMLKNCRPRVILTPHAMEFSKLSGKAIVETEKDPAAACRELSLKTGVTVLLKGPGTVISDGSRTFIVDRGCPGMATAGSGDVLSGILAALCGYVGDPLSAAAAGAYINGLAGEIAQSRQCPISMTSGDTAACVALAVTQIYNSK